MNMTDIRQSRPEEWHALMLEFLQSTREKRGTQPRPDSDPPASSRPETAPDAVAGAAIRPDASPDRLFSRRALFGRLKPSSSLRGRS